MRGILQETARNPEKKKEFLQFAELQRDLIGFLDEKGIPSKWLSDNWCAFLKALLAVYSDTPLILSTEEVTIFSIKKTNGEYDLVVSEKMG